MLCVRVRGSPVPVSRPRRPSANKAGRPMVPLDAAAALAMGLSARGPGGQACVVLQRERFSEANQKCGTHSDLGSAACRLPAEAGVGTVAEMVVEGVEYVIRLASRAGAA